MGTFEGHTLSGSCFIIFSLWSTLNQFIRFYKSHYSKNTELYHNSLTFKFVCLPGRFQTWEMEGILKISFCSIGVFMEIYTGTKNGKLIFMGNGEHASMFFFFGMSGVVDVLLHHKVPLPKSLGYVSFILAFLVESISFKFHLRRIDDLDTMIHTLIIYLALLAIIAILAEIKFPESVLAGLARSFFMMVQGTWLWQIGFILYNPIPGAKPWDGNNPDHIMIATMVFTWHLGAVFVLQMVIGGGVSAVYYFKHVKPVLGENRDKALKKHLLANEDYSELEYRQLKENESDSDV